MSCQVRNKVIVANPKVSKICIKMGKEYVKKTSEVKMESKTIQRNKVKQSPSFSKMTISKVYTEQLAPLYSSLKKTKIYAAVVLADNNLHEARLILDYKYKINNLKSFILRARSPTNKRNQIYLQKSANADNNSFSTNPNSPEISKLYEFEESECLQDDKGAKEWLDKRRKEKKVKNKVGVVIRKNAGGYQADFL